MARGIWWLRRDLRLHDNPALHAALQHGEVIPVFVLDPALLEGRYHRSAARRKAFLFAGLQALDEALRHRGSRLLLREGPPAEVLAALVAETGAEAVVAAEDHSPYARRRDAVVGERVRLVLTGGVAVRSPKAVLKENGAPFRVFTPYSRAWLGAPPSPGDLLETPDALPGLPDDLKGARLPASESLPAFPAGEDAARQRLRSFSAGSDAPMHAYADDRNRLDRDGTSVLSPYLRFGMLSPRLAAVTALEMQDAARGAGERRGAAAWLNELIWRDFYIAVLHHFPAVLRQEFDPSFRGMTWRNDAGEIEAWQSGRTGYPIVDAAMRQLGELGWMHNRARMIVASFLVKHLLVDWRIGEQWFMDQLIDGDPAANNGGWQWTAGVGTDAAPYFRVFNPVLQAKRFDPEGDFVRRWLPELRDVPGALIHEPWRMSAHQQRDANCEIGSDYPAPSVDLVEGRQRALEAFQRAKGS